MSCDDIGLSLNSKACVPGAVSGNADVQVAFDSGSASGVFGLDLPSCRVGLENDLLAATPFVLVPAFFAAFVGWPSFQVACPVAAALIAATMVYAALSGVLLGLAAMPFHAAVVTRCCDACLGCAFRRLWCVCLLRCVLFGVFDWSCDDACSFGCGEHSALHFVRDGAGSVLCGELGAWQLQPKG